MSVYISTRIHYVHKHFSCAYVSFCSSTEIMKMLKFVIRLCCSARSLLTGAQECPIFGFRALIVSRDPREALNYFWINRGQTVSTLCCQQRAEYSLANARLNWSNRLTVCSTKVQLALDHFQPSVPIWGDLCHMFLAPSLSPFPVKLLYPINKVRKTKTDINVSFTVMFGNTIRFAPERLCFGAPVLLFN